MILFSFFAQFYFSKVSIVSIHLFYIKYRVILKIRLTYSITYEQHILILDAVWKSTMPWDVAFVLFFFFFKRERERERERTWEMR